MQRPVDQAQQPEDPARRPDACPAVEEVRELVLEATNSRLAAIERIVHERTAGATGSAQPAEKAMARLRRTLGR